MFNKILIANRGEIACRIIRSAKRLGIATVAVYSDADRDALHVGLADEAVHIGAAPAHQSYLDIARVVGAAVESGAQAVHPGYGFLSENTKFAQALAAAKIDFIGPNPRAVEVMGDKIASKKFALAAGVSTVPGHADAIENGDQAVEISTAIGYPVMLKATAGGGGKGMRIAWNEPQAREGFSAATSEAGAAFGDDRVFIEKYIAAPRHIEIQVLGDKHGTIVHLGERECSIQRRHQKVIEEAPSAFLSPQMREEMGAQAVALAKAVGYDSAGTVEFIVDAQRNFYFLEMNTRLQVEHPVTELVTGIDLVEQMIRVAGGEALGFGQSDITINGWAVEARIYAENPYRNFMPSIGRLVTYREPEAGAAKGLTTRVDAGVIEGSEVSVHYDPLIAKLCTHGPSRDAAIAHMSASLDQFTIAGITHNIAFLASIMANPRWREGDISTDFIAQEYPDGFTGEAPDPAIIAKLAAIAVTMHCVTSTRSGQDTRSGPGARQETSSGKFVVRLGQARVEVEVVAGAGQSVVRIVGGSAPAGKYVVQSHWHPGRLVFEGAINDQPIAAQVRPILNGYVLSHHGVEVETRVLTPLQDVLTARIPPRPPAKPSTDLLCPMPGLLVSLGVQTGQTVQVGDALCVVEAMKMENVLRAQRNCVVKQINAKPGDHLSVDMVIMEFE
ncbi:MAG: acetyl-CoA carboxylase biotin carboxylase subunit [Alphaproteobacteria bacterium]